MAPASSLSPGTSQSASYSGFQKMEKVAKKPPPGRGELLVEELSPGILGALLSNIGWSFSGAARYFLPMH